MVVVGADVHKRTHTFVAVDEVGRKLGEKVVSATTAGHQDAVCGARERFGVEVVWAIEDCRHLSARLERDLMAGGQKVVRVPPKMMAQTRASARTPGKSDPIDALAVARAFLREPDLPIASHDEVSRELKLLVDRREVLVAQRTSTSTGCCGGSMNLILRARRNPARLIWPSIADCSVIGWLTSLVWSPSWLATSWPTSPGSPRRSMRWPNASLNACARWPPPCWPCPAVENSRRPNSSVKLPV